MQNNNIMTITSNDLSILHMSWTKNPFSTFIRVPFLWCPEKAADPVSADDEGLTRGAKRLDLLPCVESRFLTGLCSFFFFWFPHFVLCCSPSSSLTQPAVDLKRNIGSSYYPRLVNSPGRKYYLLHEWTCLFIECHHDAWYFVAPKPSLYVQK